MLRRVRLASGLVLFAYVATHFLNHGLGLISLDAAEWGRTRLFLPLWRNWPATGLLYGSFLAHLGLALWSLYSRRTLRMHVWEWAQLLLGLVIPYFLVEHVVGTRIIHELYGTLDDYRYITLALWVWQPDKGIVQSILMVVAWIHGAIGLHYWLRLKPSYRGWSPALLTLAIMVPFLGLLGFNQMGREIVLLTISADALRQTVAEFRLPGAEQVAGLYRLIDWLRGIFGASIAIALGARLLRALVERSRGLIRLTYPGGRIVAIRPGTTVLEASRDNGIPHASVCGGRGRCSTCRVRIGAGAATLPPPTPEEKRVLDRVGVPPNVRLACQIRPTQAIEVVPLLPPTATPREAFARPDYAHGRDQVIAVLFADLRAFTQLSEKKLPYDVVFVLNRYFAAMGQAISETGGHLDKFIGDGVMALYGTEGDPAAGCRAALNGARAMAERLGEVNETLKHDLQQPLRIGIGIHAGHAIVGEMGFGRATSLTAIGDMVNTASRLESMTKDLAVQLVVSAEVERLSGVALDAFPRHEVAIRGRDDSLAVRAIAEAAMLRAALARAPVPQPAA
jgi:adenylate cyclase